MNGAAASASTAAPTAPVPRRHPRVYRALVRGVLAVHAGLVAMARRRSRRSGAPAGGHRVLLTSTFHSDNWIRAHLAPMAASAHCREVVMVGSARGPSIPKVRWVMAPRLLRGSIGAVPARLATFAWIAVRMQPDVVGGFHLLVNGLVALLVGRVVNARTWYFSVGGPTELVDGGVHGENPYFLKLGVPDPAVERRLLDAVGAFDTVITMGTGARQFLRGRGATNPCHVIAGGVDAPAAAPLPSSMREFDVVLVARLVPIKQVDVFLEAVAAASRTRPDIRAAIVGDGPLRGTLERRAASLGIGHLVTFAGQQRDVVRWLQRARVFMLTSASEGLALSMMEAMACGLPAIVPDVGDLRDLVEDGVSGILVTDRRAEVFGENLAGLVSDPVRLARMSGAAAVAAARHTTAAATRQWDCVFTEGAERRSL